MIVSSHSLMNIFSSEFITFQIHNFVGDTMLTFVSAMTVFLMIEKPFTLVGKFVSKCFKI